MNCESPRRDRSGSHGQAAKQISRRGEAGGVEEAEAYGVRRSAHHETMDFAWPFRSAAADVPGSDRELSATCGVKRLKGALQNMNSHTCGDETRRPRHARAHELPRS